VSWKPSRSSGIMFDKYDRKSREHLDKYAQMLQTDAYIHFENLKKFSMHLYLHWLNENKKHCSLAGKSFNPSSPWRSLEEVARFPFVIPMLTRNKDKVYLPLAKLL
jgi:hypothetical protein